MLDIACGNDDIAIVIAFLRYNFTASDKDFARINRIHLKSILAGLHLKLEYVAGAIFLVSINRSAS